MADGLASAGGTKEDHFREVVVHAAELLQEVVSVYVASGDCIQYLVLRWQRAGIRGRGGTAGARHGSRELEKGLRRVKPVKRPRSKESAYQPLIEREIPTYSGEVEVHTGRLAQQNDNALWLEHKLPPFLHEILGILIPQPNLIGLDGLRFECFLHYS
jgi:hypothetical protein